MTNLNVLPLTQVTGLHARQLKDESPWVWLYEFENAQDPTERYRLTNNPQPITYGEDSEGVGLVYSPAAIAHSDIKLTLKGDLPTITINIGNSILLSHELDEGAGFTDKAARILIVSKKELANIGAAVTENAKIIRSRSTTEVVAIEMSAFNIFKAKIPPRLFKRKKCDYVFGDDNCGYNISVAGAGFTECPGYDLAACETIGADEEANVNIVTVDHPAAFGGYPGMPIGGRS